MNVFFDNFGNEDLVSKTARERLKKLLKSKITNDKSEEINSNEFQNDILENYFKKEKGKVLSLKFDVKGNEIHVILVKAEKVLTQQELNKQKLKERLQYFKDQRYQLRDRKTFLDNVKKEKKELAIDDRVTSKMVNMYNLAREKFGYELPNPKEVLDNKDFHIKKFIEYVTMVLKNSNSEMELVNSLDNEYSNYIETVTGFSYKQLLSVFKENIKKKEVQAQPEQKVNIPEAIHENLEDSSSDEENEINSDAGN